MQTQNEKLFFLITNCCKFTQKPIDIVYPRQDDSIVDKRNRTN